MGPTGWSGSPKFTFPEMCYQYGNFAAVNESSGFPKRLAALLAERNLTQLELAARVGVTRAAMSRYVSGEREPRFVTLVRIAEELEVHIGDLISPAADSVETALRTVARATLTEEQKARLRQMVDGGGQP